MPFKTRGSNPRRVHQLTEERRGMIKIHLFDNTPAKPGEKHGSLGPTHCGNITVDYEYQAEMWVQEIEKDYTHVVRVDVPDLGREWLRDDSGKMVEKTIEANRKHPQESIELFFNVLNRGDDDGAL